MLPWDWKVLHISKSFLKTLKFYNSLLNMYTSKHEHPFIKCCCKSPSVLSVKNKKIIAADYKNEKEKYFLKVQILVK